MERLDADLNYPEECRVRLREPRPDLSQVRAAQVQTPDGGTEIRIRDDVKSPWKSWIKVGPDEILNFIDFTADGKSAYLISSIGSDTARVVERNIAANSEKCIASSDEVDAGNVLVEPSL